MASSIVTPGILYLWLMQRKQQRDSQRAMASRPTGLVTTGSESDGTSPNTLPSTGLSAASATSVEGPQTSPGDSSISEPRAHGTSMTDSILIVTPTIDSPQLADNLRSTSRRERGGR